MKVWEISLYPESREELEDKLRKIKYYRSDEEIEELYRKIKGEGRYISEYFEELARLHSYEFDKGYHTFIPSDLWKIISEAFDRFEDRSEHYLFDKGMCVVTNIKIVLDEGDDISNLKKLVDWFNPLRVFKEGFGEEQPLFMKEVENKTGIYVSYVLRELTESNKWRFTYEDYVLVDNFFSGILGTPRLLANPNRAEWEINLYQENSEELEARLREIRFCRDYGEIHKLENKVKIWGEEIGNYLKKKLHDTFEVYPLRKLLEHISRDLSNILYESYMRFEESFDPSNHVYGRMCVVTNIRVVLEMGDEIRLVKWFNPLRKIYECFFEQKYGIKPPPNFLGVTGIYVDYIFRELIMPNEEWKFTYNDNVPIETFFSEVLASCDH